jgi:small subunit ribosomal protein S9
MTTETKQTSEPKQGYWWGCGRRKSSIARVRIRLGEGRFLINENELDIYFKRPKDRYDVISPLSAVGLEKSFDVFANVNGGGSTGQAGAIRLGIARALKSYDISFLSKLRDGGHLTRDPRMKERKKYGQRGARRRFQFSKR